MIQAYIFCHTGFYTDEPEVCKVEALDPLDNL